MLAERIPAFVTHGAPQNPICTLGIEGYKQFLRGRYCRVDTPVNFEDALEHAKVFWSLYEQVNRDYCPDDPVYSVVRSGVTPVAANDLFTFVGAASRQARALEIIVSWEGTASAAARVIWQRSTGGTTGGGALTPEKFNQLSPAAGAFANIFTTWTGQPSTSGNPTHSWSANAFGGAAPWKAMPGEEIYMQGSSEQNSLRNAAGTGVLSATVIFEEM